MILKLRLQRGHRFFEGGFLLRQLLILQLPSLGRLKLRGSPISPFATAFSG